MVVRSAGFTEEQMSCLHICQNVEQTWTPGQMLLTGWEPRFLSRSLCPFHVRLSVKWLPIGRRLIFSGSEDAVSSIMWLNYQTEDSQFQSSSQPPAVSYSNINLHRKWNGNFAATLSERSLGLICREVSPEIKNICPLTLFFYYKAISPAATAHCVWYVDIMCRGAVHAGCLRLDRRTDLWFIKFVLILDGMSSKQNLLKNILNSSIFDFFNVWMKWNSSTSCVFSVFQAAEQQGSEEDVSSLCESHSLYFFFIDFIFY